MFELYEKCGGKDMEAIYKQVMDGGMLDSEARCYKDGCFWYVFVYIRMMLHIGWGYPREKGSIWQYFF